MDSTTLDLPLSALKNCISLLKVPIHNLKVLIIIPCYNEEASLPTVLKEIKQLDLPSKYTLDVVVVNDASKDNTAKVAYTLNTKVLNLPMNLGIGGAVQTGLKYALNKHYDLAIQLDGDGQHPPAEVIRLLEAYENFSADITIGSRFLNNEGYQSSFVRRLGINYFYRLNKFFTGNYIYDSTSGFRLLNKKAISLAAINYPDDYPEPESLIIFAKAGLTIKEIPVVMRARQGGESSIQKQTSIYYCIKVSIGMFFSYLRNNNLKWTDYKS